MWNASRLAEVRDVERAARKSFGRMRGGRVRERVRRGREARRGGRTLWVAGGRDWVVEVRISVSILGGRVGMFLRGALRETAFGRVRVIWKRHVRGVGVCGRSRAVICGTGGVEDQTGAAQGEREAGVRWRVRKAVWEGIRLKKCGRSRV